MKKINVNRKNLSNEIYLKVGFSKIITDNLVDDIIKILFKKIIENDIIKLSNFGSFIKKRKKERIGRNPKTNEIKIISSRSVITFKPSSYFKKEINLKNNE
tara:strand:- start:67 stop:369 length:303 start_codon:yes stop_codon:yes gene_type:complete